MRFQVPDARTRPTRNRQGSWGRLTPRAICLSIIMVGAATVHMRLGEPRTGRGFTSRLA